MHRKRRQKQNFGARSCSCPCFSVCCCWGCWGVPLCATSIKFVSLTKYAAMPCYFTARPAKDDRRSCMLVVSASFLFLRRRSFCSPFIVFACFRAIQVWVRAEPPHDINSNSGAFVLRSFAGRYLVFLWRRANIVFGDKMDHAHTLPDWRRRESTVTRREASPWLIWSTCRPSRRDGHRRH